MRWPRPVPPLKDNLPVVKPWHLSRKLLAESFAVRSHGRMPAREEAARWTTTGERVEPYIPRRHQNGPTGG